MEESISQYFHYITTLKRKRVWMCHILKNVCLIRLLFCHKYVILIFSHIVGLIKFLVILIHYMFYTINNF